jgi:hypothetical protein
MNHLHLKKSDLHAPISHSVTSSFLSFRPSSLLDPANRQFLHVFPPFRLARLFNDARVNRLDVVYFVHIAVFIKDRL